MKRCRRKLRRGRNRANERKVSDRLMNINEEVFEGVSFKYIELFAGIGGFRQALDRLGGECVFASEIDRFASKAYEALYGHKPAGDITKIDAKDIPDHDLLVGGFPCQAFSVAGKRLGFEDTRGTLFFEIARIAKEKRPKALLLENVKGLVNHDKGRTLDVMIQTLNEIGYVVDFEVLNSKYFGVPQNRERIFIIAIREDLIEVEPWHDIKGYKVVPRGKRRIGGYKWAKTFNFDWPKNGEVTTRLRDILEAEVDEKYYLSEEKTAKLVAQFEVGGLPNRAVLGHVKCPKPNQNTAVYSNEKQAPTLRNQHGYGVPKIVEHQVPKWIPKPDEINRTLRSGGKASLSDKHNYDHIAEQVEIPPKYRIRKLTPKECWRLQGFSDEAHDAVMNAGISDSQRYKQAGNAVTVNVIDAIGRRLLEKLKN